MTIKNLGPNEFSNPPSKHDKHDRPITLSSYLLLIQLKW